MSPARWEWPRKLAIEAGQWRRFWPLKLSLMGIPIPGRLLYGKERRGPL